MKNTNTKDEILEFGEKQEKSMQQSTPKNPFESRFKKPTKRIETLDPERIKKGQRG